MLAWIDATADDQKSAFENYDRAVNAIQVTLPSTTWYNSPIFIAAASFYQGQKRPDLAYRSDTYLRQHLASIDAFAHPRTDSYWTANDKLALQLLGSEETMQAQRLFKLSLNRILSARDSDAILPSQEFALLADSCIENAADRQRLLAKANGFLNASKKDWLERKPGRSIEASIYANQLMEYSLLALELGTKENALKTMMQAVGLAEKGYLNKSTKLNVFNNYAYVLRSIGRHEDASLIEKKHLLPPSQNP